MAQDKKDSEVKYEVGSVVIGKVKGYPPWPGEVSGLAPNNKSLTFPDYRPRGRALQGQTRAAPFKKNHILLCPVLPSGRPVSDDIAVCPADRSSAWLPTKDVSRLLPHEISTFLSEPTKRKGDLLEGYKIANDPHEWRKQKDSLAQRERANEAAGISTNDDVDELDDEPDDDDDDDGPSAKKPKAKKRKRESAAAADDKEKKGRRKRSEPTKKRAGKTKKSAEHIESEEDDDKTPTDKPTSSKADKDRPSKRPKKESVAPIPAAADDDGDDAAMANDPEATKVKEWRHKLQRAFLTKTSPAAEVRLISTFGSC